MRQSAEVERCAANCSRIKVIYDTQQAAFLLRCLQCANAGALTFSLRSVLFRSGLVTRTTQASVPFHNFTFRSGFQYTRDTWFQCRKLYSLGLHVQPSSHSSLTAPAHVRLAWENQR